MSQRQAVLDLHLHAKQSVAFNSPATEILYGGAAGGGKSHLMRVAAVIWAAEIPGLQVYLFRRIHEDLVKNHMEGPSGFRTLLAVWENAGLAKIVENEIRFWNGSKIYLCHCQHDKDRFKYQGAEIHVLLMDELTHFSEVIYRFLRNRVRAVGLALPTKYAGLFPRIICGSNPGNLGHLWVKQAWVDRLVPYAIEPMVAAEGGMQRQYIPAVLEDNPSMMTDDPGYEQRLEGLGSKELVKAMRWGDWNVIEGAFFDGWEHRRHVIRPAALPEWWTRFRAMDWGYAKPFSVGWFAVPDDDWRHPDGFTIPRGALVQYREWYGILTDAQTGEFQLNTGLRLAAEDIAAGIAMREAAEKIEYGVLDPAAFTSDGGPSIAERMMRAKPPVLFRHADNARAARAGALGGWDQMRARLKGDADGRPMLVFFETCRHAIRTIPAMQHDEAKPEDLDTDLEDHCPDMVRYACMSRPWQKPKPKPVDEAVDLRLPTLNELMRNRDRRKGDANYRI